MSQFDDTHFGEPARRLNVSTLTTLRATGALGQTLAVVVTAFGLRLAIPVVDCLAVIVVSAILSLYVRLRFRDRRRLDDSWTTALLAFDVVELATLLALTGGLVNPFSVLLLAPVITASSALPARLLAIIVLLTLLAATLISEWFLPLPLGAGELWQAPPLIRVGAFAAISVSAVFIALYAYRVAEDSRVLASALAATELALARVQHLSQLDGLAAAAAHELGTPLSTIALVAHELVGSKTAQEAYGDDLKLLESSARQCRDILAKLATPQEMAKGGIAETALSSLLEELCEPWRLSGVVIDIACKGEGAEPILSRNAGALFGLGNIIENGVGHANARVDIDAGWSANRLSIRIADDGPGFPPAVLRRMGEPYISTPVGDNRGPPSEGGGMGLGLFISIALLERSGASVKFANGPRGGAEVRIAWPRAAIEADRRTPRETLDTRVMGASQT